MASVTYGKCNYGKNIYGKNIYGKNIMANETEPFRLERRKGWIGQVQVREDEGRIGQGSG